MLGYQGPVTEAGKRYLLSFLNLVTSTMRAGALHAAAGW